MESVVIRENGNPTSKKIGGVTVFTYQGAIDAFKKFSRCVYNDLSFETSVALSNESEKMHELGFTWEQIEKLEIDSIIVCNKRN